MRLHLLLHSGLLLSTFLACFFHGLACSSTSSSLTGTMADFLPAFDLNVRLEDDDDGNLPFEHEKNSGIFSFVTQFILFFYDIHR
jgi:hypothetical protein